MTRDRQTPDNDASLLLLDHYQSSVPADFQNALLRKLETELPRRQWKARRLLGAAAIAAAVGMIVWIVVPGRGPRLPSPGISGVGTAPASHGSVAYAMTTFADEVAQAPLIVLVRIMDVHELTADCIVIETLYGTTTETSLKVDLDYGDPEIRNGYEADARRWFLRDHAREPSPEELLVQMQYMQSLKAGRQGVLMLAPPAQHNGNVKGKVLVYHAVRIDFQDPVPLLGWEKRIADVLRDGSYLKPFTLSTFVMEAKIAAADAIVHATLTHVSDADATWHVDKTLKGKVPADVRIPHELFDRRAAALVTIAALSDPALNDPATRSARIQQEKQMLLKNELTLGKEALLFLDNVQMARAEAIATLQAREFKSEKAENLAFTEASITRLLDASPTHQYLHEKPLATIPGASNDRRRNRVPDDSSSMTLGVLSLEDEISRAPLIVRATIEKWHNWNVDYTVTRIILGQTDAKTITLDASFGSPQVTRLFEDEARQKFVQGHGRGPTADELQTILMADHGIIPGREVLLFLEPSSGKDKFRSMGIRFDSPPRYSIDTGEKEIIQAIEQGTYLEPAPIPGDIFLPKVKAAEAIIRGELVEITDAGARWRISKIFKGRTTDFVTPDIVVDHSSFQERAEAIVNNAALSDPTLKDPIQYSAAIKAKITEMLKAELIPGKEGILFLDHVRTEGQATHARLQYRLYEDSKRAKLDDVEQAIADPAKAQMNL